ncbi:hypothetical protein [Paucilactobacillus wasatchensis]|uniref:Lipoprotein n=1 Tax=Paucilactobacillus wasatchensis TaxID=1335616 RepID=A0A0D1A915_9LACO|nr:hypothetical protein [Paucilactobacillus wasatchensis]KIS04162.1 hypothetical protein WDC_0225 [Paucilactobacillus wasatchensis]
MQKSVISKKIMLGTLTLLSIGVLAGCGSKNTSNNASSSSSSVAKVSAATKAYNAANKLIKAGKYQQALNKLQAATHQTSKIKGLIANLKTLIAAKEDYGNSNYADAQSGIATLKSNESASSTELKQEAATLATKVTQAQKMQSSSSSSAVASSGSSSTASSTADSVIPNFAKAAGYYGKSGYQFDVTGQTGSTYTIEVRQNNQAGDVANLVGIYQYNSTTGGVTKTF